MAMTSKKDKYLDENGMFHRLGGSQNWKQNQEMEPPISSGLLGL